KDDTTGQATTTSRPSAASNVSSRATYSKDETTGPVTTTAHPSAASNVPSHAASVTAVPDDEHDSAVNGPTSRMTMETRSINHGDFGDKDDDGEKTDEQQEPIDAGGSLVDVQVQVINDITRQRRADKTANVTEFFFEGG
ncbi:hypothetical protein PAXINDRAFT_22159, partial [Paxillus involutus ATCC 200175]